MQELNVNRTYMNPEGSIVKVYMNWDNFYAYTNSTYVLGVDMSLPAASYFYSKSVEAGIIWG